MDLPIEGLSGSRLSLQNSILNGIIFWRARQEKAFVPGDGSCGRAIFIDL
jgi:hypothetical protein